MQAAPVAFNVERTLQKLGDLAADAAYRRAHLALFPEAFVSAYPRGRGFGAVVGRGPRKGASSSAATGKAAARPS